MKRFGAILFWLGVVITIVGVGVSIFGGSRAFDAVSSAVDDAAVMPGGTATVQMEQGDVRTIYEQVEAGAASAECTVRGPDGEPVTLSTTPGFGGALGDISYEEVGDFEATQAGSYQVECTGGGTTLISPALDFTTLGRGALGLLGGILGVGLGLLMMLIGAVLWFVGRSKAKNAASGPMGGAGGAYGGGTYGSAPPPPGSAPPPPGSGGPSTYGSGPSGSGPYGSGPYGSGPYGSGEGPRGGSTPPPPPPSGY
ncbi:MAG: hypothetical protein WA962_03255 [Ornithinimicrobium sp.]